MNEFRSRIFGLNEPAGSPLVESKNPSGANADVGLRTIVVSRLETRSSDTRGADRHRLPEHGITLSYNGETHAVELINLSGGGAMIRTDFEPMLWDRVDLHLMQDRTVECLVQWLRDDRVGLEFAHETHIDCPPEERDAVLREVIARSFPQAIAAAADQPAESDPEPEPEELRRGEKRHPLIWSGVIHFNHDSTPVRLRNISSKGALIDCHTDVPEGSELLLDLGEAGSLFAAVCWVIGDQLGLNFRDAFDLRQLARSRPEVASTDWQAPAYLRYSRDVPASTPDRWRRLSVPELSNELEGFLKR